MVVNVDNQGSITLANNPVFQDRSKGYSHCTRDLVNEQMIHLEYIPTTDMLADLLTKSLPRAQHEQLSEGIGLF